MTNILIMVLFVLLFVLTVSGLTMFYIGFILPVYKNFAHSKLMKKQSNAFQAQKAKECELARKLK